MSYEPGTNIPLTDISYGQYCFSRLPCSVCMKTNQLCPLVSNAYTYEVTCSAMKGADTDANR